MAERKDPDGEILDLQSLFGVQGKVCLVTGGGRGIGLMITRGLVINGAKVYICSRKAAVCEGVAEELNKLGKGKCIGFGADLLTEEGTKKAAKYIEEREDHLDVLVNNSGTNWAQPLSKYSEAAFKKVLNLNLGAVFFLSRNLVPLLKRNATKECPSRIINIGSINGLSTPQFETYAYSASKAATHHLTRVLANKLAQKFITVNCLAPGPFQSKMMKKTLETYGGVIAQQNPLKRIGVPSDMAGATIFLCSKAGRYLTGTVIPVDGGTIIKAKL